ncbi:alpha/beta hydrolase [Lacticaseibacillus yichunensis]|uniref:Alpha/beta hydrolase n=1 Tax=Lacticaseibacillus yichunensis TaxID=2486015 RepID=A0ABW4CQ47_9LACO|nr:alpha/beta hydrolase [Lacticaseibacillus yichunensis]
MRHRHYGTTAVCVVCLLLSAGVFGASQYFYDYAFVPAKKTFLSSHEPARTTRAKTWLAKVEKETWHMQAADSDLQLVADFVPAATKTARTVVIAHGYMNTKEDMAPQIQLFHDAGFNVLAPDDRGHGQSEGDYIGYGWPDRLDYLKWLDKLLARTGENSQIALYGVSMGGATVMYLSGENLPKQVGCIIEDCGYTSIIDELAYQAKAMFKLPKWPLVPAVALNASVRAKYNVFDASAVAALHHNTRPIFFIHGAKDDFVPTSMVYENFAATDAPKELWVVPGAGHAKSDEKDPVVYADKVVGFINAYMPPA